MPFYVSFPLNSVYHSVSLNLSFVILVPFCLCCSFFCSYAILSVTLSHLYSLYLSVCVSLSLKLFHLALCQSHFFVRTFIQNCCCLCQTRGGDSGSVSPVHRGPPLRRVGHAGGPQRAHVLSVSPGVLRRDDWLWQPRCQFHWFACHPSCSYCCCLAFITLVVIAVVWLLSLL